jgi:hypothetical protein
LNTQTSSPLTLLIEGDVGCVLSCNADVPLGFGVTAKSTSECRTADPNAIVVFHQVCVKYVIIELSVLSYLLLDLPQLLVMCSSQR